MESKGLVYLAGGIAGQSGPEIYYWRRIALHYFCLRGIRVRNPLRGKSELLKFDLIQPDFNAYKDLSVFFTSKGIMARDFNDVKQSDVILINLLKMTTPSIGSMMELAWAYSMQKPTVVIMEESGNPHDNHPMIHEAISFRVSTLEEGLAVTASILGEE